MLKNITRRTWSVLIALVMIWTTFCMGQPLTASATVSSETPGVKTGVTFVVPEAIYLKPLYNSYYQSTVSFTSRNMGAEKYGRVPKIALNGVLCAAGIGCIMALIVNLFARPLLGIYSSTGEVILVGIRRIRIICIPYFLMGMMDALVGALRGIGYSLTPMFVSLMGIGVFRVVWVAVVLSVPSLSSNVENIYWSYPFSWLISVSILGVCYVVLWQRRKAKLSDHHTD